MLGDISQNNNPNSDTASMGYNSMSNAFNLRFNISKRETLKSTLNGFYSIL